MSPDSEIDAPVTNRPDRVAVPFSERRLDNGLRLLHHEERALPLVAVHLMVHVGSKHERPGKTGFAHLFEHLLFQGSEHVPPGEHFRTIQDVGGTLNGSTFFDRTNYFEVVPSNALERVLWLESDRFGHFLPGLTEEKFEAQRSVVMNERRQRYDNQPYGLWFEHTLELLFDADHPYGHSTIGSMEDLEAATLDDARDFFRTWYRPPNATLVVAGDVGEAEAAAQAERWFGPIEGGAAPSQPDVEPGALAEQRRLDLVEPVELPRIFVTWHVPGWRDDRRDALGLAARILAGNRGARLPAELVYRREVAQEVWATRFSELEDTGLFVLGAAGRPEAGIDDLLGGIDEEIHRLADEGPGADELDRARLEARLALVGRLSNVGGRTDALAHAAVLLGDPADVERRQAILDEVGVEEVREAVRTWIDHDRRAVVTYTPARDD